MHFELAATTEISSSIRLLLIRSVTNYVPWRVQIYLRQVVGRERQGILSVMALERLRLMKHVLELALLELEMLLLERSLLACLRLHLGLLSRLSGRLQDETLIDVWNEVVVQMLSLRRHSAGKSHSLRYILALIYYIASLHAFVVFHRLVQYLLDIHWTAHLILLVYGVILSLWCLSSCLRDLV